MTDPVQTEDKPFPFHAERMHPSPARRRSGGPSYFWLASWFLALVTLSLLTWAATRPLPGAKVSTENDLRKPGESPKLNPSSGNAVALAQAPVKPVETRQPEPTTPPRQEVQETKTVEPFKEASLPVPPKVEVPQVFSPPIIEAPAPVLPPLPEAPQPPLAPVLPPPAFVPSVVKEPTPPAPLDTDFHPPFLAHQPRGDTPMIRNWKTLAFLTLTAVHVPNQVAVAQAGDDVKTLLQSLEKMEQRLGDSINKVGVDVSGAKSDINVLKQQSLTQHRNLDKAVERIEALEGQITKVLADVDALKRRVPPEPVAANSADKSAIEDIRNRLSQIEQTLGKLQSTSSSSRVALSPPTTGRVLFVNSYAEDLLLVLNGRSFRVNANSVLPIDTVPAGALTYEVRSQTWGFLTNNTTTLAPNETLTLTAR